MAPQHVSLHRSRSISTPAMRPTDRLAQHSTVQLHAHKFMVQGLIVGAEFFAKSGTYRFDMVSPEQCVSSCFTKAYGTNYKGV